MSIAKNLLMNWRNSRLTLGNDNFYDLIGQTGLDGICFMPDLSVAVASYDRE